MKENSIKQNIAYNWIYQILILIVPLITTPYVSRVLSAEGIGLYSITTAIVKYFWLFALLGMANYGNREIAKVRDDKNKLSSKFWSLFYFQAISSIIMIVLFTLYIIIYGYKKYSITLLCQLPYLISAIFEVGWYFYGKEKFKCMVIRNTIIKILTTVFIFIFVKGRNDVWIYVLINSIGLLLSQLCLWPIIFKEVNFKKPELSLIRQHLKPNLILFVSVLAVSIYTIMDKIMLENFANRAEVGFYENTEKIFNVCIAIVGAVGAVMLPRMSFLVEKNENEKIKSYMEKSLKYIMILSIAISFGIASISREFTVLFFGNEYARCGILLIAISPAIIFYCWENILRTQYLLPKGKDEIFVKGTIFAAIANFIINLILIPKYNALGAVIGTVFAQLVETFYQTIRIKKELPIKSYIINLVYYFVIAIIMFIICRNIGNLLGGKVYTIFIQIIVGGAFFITMTYFYMKNHKDKLLLNILNKRKKG